MGSWSLVPKVCTSVWIQWESAFRSWKTPWNPALGALGIFVSLDALYILEAPQVISFIEESSMESSWLTIGLSWSNPHVAFAGEQIHVIHRCWVKWRCSLLCIYIYIHTRWHFLVHAHIWDSNDAHIYPIKNTHIYIYVYKQINICIYIYICIHQPHFKWISFSKSQVLF